MPTRAKGVCARALGYFIFPLDAIFDALVPIGYVDDLRDLAAAGVAVAVLVSGLTRALAQQKLRD